jgi:preprotein translocase subunit SecA
LLTEVKTVVPSLPAKFTEAHVKESGEAAMEEVIDAMHEQYEVKEAALNAEKMRTLERLVLLGTIDRLWVYHLTELDAMRQGIGLQGYGGRDPLVEFKREAFDMFDQLTEHIQQNTARRIFHVTLTQQTQAAAPPANTKESGPGDDSDSGNGATASATTAARRAQAAAAAAGNGDAATSNAASAAVPGKVGRNDPCPCGSGRKYKKCHGAGVGV